MQQACTVVPAPVGDDVDQRRSDPPTLPGVLDEEGHLADTRRVGQQQVAHRDGELPLTPSGDGLAAGLVEDPGEQVLDLSTAPEIAPPQGLLRTPRVQPDRPASAGVTRSATTTRRPARRGSRPAGQGAGSPAGPGPELWSSWRWSSLIGGRQASSLLPLGNVTALTARSRDLRPSPLVGPITPAGRSTPKPVRRLLPVLRRCLA